MSSYSKRNVILLLASGALLYMFCNHYREVCNQPSNPDINFVSNQIQIYKRALLFYSVILIDL